MEIVTRVFIGILQNIFPGWAIICSQSPKVTFSMNFAFPLKMVYVHTESSVNEVTVFRVATFLNEMFHQI